MDFNPTDIQQAWRQKAADLARALPAEAPAADVVGGAARAGLIDPRIDLLSAALAVEAIAIESAGPAIAFAVHTSVVLSLGERGGDSRFESLVRGEVPAAIALSADDVATAADATLSGRASWVGPLTDHGLAIVGARLGEPGDETSELSTFAVSLDRPGVDVEIVQTAALSGFVCGHVSFDRAACAPVGPPVPIMARVRVLLAAAGLGMGRRALREALEVSRAHRYRGAGGEQTAQGLLADAATELDAAMVLTWKAAAGPLSLAEASMAKLAATDAAQKNVMRATQVVGAASVQRGHIVERLAQDVRALELFAGRTEALRDAAAEALLPQGATS